VSKKNKTKNGWSKQRQGKGSVRMKVTAAQRVELTEAKMDYQEEELFIERYSGKEVFYV